MQLLKRPSVSCRLAINLICLSRSSQAAWSESSPASASRAGTALCENGGRGHISPTATTQVNLLTVLSFTVRVAGLRALLAAPSASLLATLAAILATFLKIFVFLFVAARLVVNLLRFRFVC